MKHSRKDYGQADSAPGIHKYSAGDPSESYFDQLGEQFDEYMNEYDVERRIELVFSYHLKDYNLNNRKVLEVGCGTGRFSGEILRLGGELTILDIGSSLVRAVSDALSCVGVVGDTLELPFPDQSFDAVISSECVEHTHDPLKAIREICRVCRPHGMVCVTSPNKLWYPALLIAQRLRLRKFEGIENWIFPRQAGQVMTQEGMTGIRFGGCHILPFQLGFIQPILRLVDSYGGSLYPLMINFGISATKPPPARVKP